MYLFNWNEMQGKMDIEKATISVNTLTEQRN